MKFGIWFDHQNVFDPKDIVEYSRVAEEAGWDGVFVSDSPAWQDGYTDPFVLLGGMAAITERIILGTWIIPLPRRSPWQVALEVATLDQLSNGRVLLGVGSGGTPGDYTPLSLPDNPKVRAEMLDESLEIMDRLWTGEEISYDGEHYQITDYQLKTQLVQQPRVPILIAGNWPARKPFERGQRWDGMVPNPVSDPEVLEEMMEYFANNFDGSSQMGLAITPKYLENEEFATVLGKYSENITWLIIMGLVHDLDGEAFVDMDAIRAGSSEIAKLF